MNRPAALGVAVILSVIGILIGVSPMTAAAGGGDIAMEPVVLLRLSYDAVHPDALKPLQTGVVVVTTPPAGPQDIPATWQAALRRQPATFASADKLYLLSSGPVLDQPDHVAVRALQREGRTFTLHVTYTSARLAGLPLRRNVPWLPVVQISLPHGLSPGTYKVTASWQAVASLPAGKPLGQPQNAEFLVFEVLP